MIELDHVSQKLHLKQQRARRSRGFQTEIEEIIRRQKDLEPRMKEHTVPYSEIQAFYKECYKILDDIENQQLEIDASLKELRKGEKVAQEKSTNTNSVYGVSNDMLKSNDYQVCLLIT